MGNSASCIKKNPDIVTNSDPKSVEGEKKDGGKKYRIDPNNPKSTDNIETSNNLITESTETIFGSDSDSDDDNLRGVSNVVYRKDFVQSVYSFTSEQLGVGATGPIRVVINRRTGGRFAMKTINLLGYNLQQRERLLQEVLILGRLHHPNIVKLYEVFQTSNSMYLIQELLGGGELYSRLVHSPQGKFSEEYCKKILRDILNAIFYLHETKNIAHRDLKLANIMFTDKSPDADLKLIDFGLSKFVSGSEYMHSLVGTRYYIAPEVFMKDYQGVGYNKSCDMWSIGIITYFLLTGHNPLPPQMANLPFDQLNIDEIPFPHEYWKDISEEAKSFVQGLLCIDPVKRMTVVEAQNHPWMKVSSPIPSISIPATILNAMQEFQNYNHLKKAALTAVAYHLNNNDLMRLSDAFEYFDKQDDGSISFDEFRDALMTLRDKETFAKNTDIFAITTDETKLRKLFDSMDFDQRGYINYSEFLAACLARKEGLRREYAELIFKLIDRDNEGSIEIEDLHLFFGDEITIDEIKSCIIQTFGELKTRLTENDLEMIMNTKMITTNRAEELVKQQNEDVNSDEDEDYISVTSLFKRNVPVGAVEDDSMKEVDVDAEEMKRRCQALSGVDKMSSSLTPSTGNE